MKQINLKIYGRVQGVNFRYFIFERAKEIGLTGWVKNEDDGSVLILAEGSEESLKKLIEYCQSGPQFATIDRVEVKWKKTTSGFDDFVIKY
ncbi:MAG: acylphosphatase [Candidatus Portnoybacteria bacterium]|nr:acylphosphatase [Candidatus Portnoybacteria bacterium]